jgi:hypothetical protein
VVGIEHRMLPGEVNGRLGALKHLRRLLRHELI